MQRLSEYIEYIKYREGYLEGMESLYVVGRIFHGDFEISFTKVWATSEKAAVSKVMGWSPEEFDIYITNNEDIVVSAVKI